MILQFVGPGMYDGMLNPSRKPTVLAGKTVGDRYAQLQRRVDELERLYADAKKSVRRDHLFTALY